MVRKVDVRPKVEEEVDHPFQIMLGGKMEKTSVGSHTTVDVGPFLNERTSDVFVTAQYRISQGVFALAGNKALRSLEVAGRSQRGR